MGYFVKITSWKDQRESYKLNPKTGELTSIPLINLQESSGTLKKFLWGKWLAIYSDNNIWFIQYKSKRIKIKEIKIETKISYFWYSLKFDKIDGCFFDFSNAKIFHKIDPTYDELDAYCDHFAFWLQQLRGG